MFFHELAIGSEFTGSGRTLTEADLSIACMVSGDWHPIHADETYAKAKGLRGRLFHGAFGRPAHRKQIAHRPAQQFAFVVGHAVV